MRSQVNTSTSQLKLTSALGLFTELDLVQCQMADGDPGATPQTDLMAMLAAELQGNTSLKTLDLRHNFLGTNSIEILADALTDNKTLTTLDIRNNDMQSEVRSSVLARHPVILIECDLLLDMPNFE